ncbi:MAG TPA: zf-HC2 domain-containing protein, partial [Gemmatimonadaceae bacterium]|nr:zf-HC2 domain-containing protein [Gemmatimonadaceae bacterium]
MRHPDEGTIHAWLDGALPPGEGAALEAHVAGCAACAAAVAEARGVLAASSRILSALDSVPGGVIPEAPMSSGARAAVRRRTVRRRFRELRVSNGAWRAAAAVLVLAGGTWLAAVGTRREKHPPMQFAMYVDTTSIRIPGVVVDAPPSSARMLVEAAPVPSRPPERYATSRVAGGIAAKAGSAAAEASANTTPPMVASAPVASAPTSSVVAANELRLEQQRSTMADRAEAPVPAVSLRAPAPRRRCSCWPGGPGS